MGSAQFISRLLDVIQNDIAPKTRAGVQKGNKLFGAAVLLKKDLSLVIAETNNETGNPLWHGEVHCITKLYERERSTVPNPSDCIFIATHEPCSLCLSAITWAGYDNFYFLFSHQDSRDSFGIPHDIKILMEVFAVPPVQENQELYNRSNAFWKSHNIVQMIDGFEPSEKEPLKTRVSELVALYADLSSVYQASKGDKGIPLS